MKRIVALALALSLIIVQPAHAVLIWYSNLDSDPASTITPQVGAQTCTNINGPSSSPTAKFGNSVLFVDSSEQYLNCGTAHITSTDNWTVAAWIRPDGSVLYRSIVVSGDDDGAAVSGFTMYMNPSDQLECQAITGTNAVNNTVSVATISEVGVWTHVACVKNGTSLKGYINGVEDGSATAASATMDYTGDLVKFFIAAFAVPAVGTFLGYIDEVRVYDSVEDPAAIAAIDPTVTATGAVRRRH